MSGLVLHNAARRYCLDRITAHKAIYLPHFRARQAAHYREWLGARRGGSRVDATLRALGLDDAPPLATTPLPPESDARALPERVAMLAGILHEVERECPETIRDVTAARERLVAAGERARVWGTRYAEGDPDHPVVRQEPPDWTPHQLAQAEEERAAYLAFAATVSEAEAASAAPVPSRHVLNETERWRVRTKLRQRWGADPGRHYWYPLNPQHVPVGVAVLAVQDAYFHEEVGAVALKDLLRRHKVTRVWQVEESRLSDDLEQDPSWCTFYQSGGETYWTAPTLDWLIYASHERSLTFAGEWLVPAIKRLWPNWERRLYTGYDYE